MWIGYGCVGDACWVCRLPMGEEIMYRRTGVSSQVPFLQVKISDFYVKWNLFMGIHLFITDRASNSIVRPRSTAWLLRDMWRTHGEGRWFGGPYFYYFLLVMFATDQYISASQLEKSAPGAPKQVSVDFVLEAPAFVAIMHNTAKDTSARPSDWLQSLYRYAWGTNHAERKDAGLMHSVISFLSNETISSPYIRVLATCHSSRCWARIEEG